MTVNWRPTNSELETIADMATAKLLFEIKSMSISSVSSAPNAASNIVPAAPASPARRADSDYKVRSAHTSQVKDSDGDYKSITAASSPAIKAPVPSRRL